jgi:hypothetical protein
LIDAATQEGEVAEANLLLQEVERFIDEKELVPEKVRVPAWMIYYNYIKWKQANNETNILSRKGFFQYFKRYFHHYVDSGHIVYNVSKKTLDLSLTAKLEMRKMVREEREWYAKKRKRKKSE